MYSIISTTVIYRELLQPIYPTPELINLNSMVRGAKIDIGVSFRTGEGSPIGEDLISDIQLDLYSTANKATIAASVSLGDGITREGVGVYRIIISGEDTLKLPTTGTALLEGWLLPTKKKIVFDFGSIKDNIKNNGN